MKKNFLALALTGILAVGAISVPAMGAVSFADINNVPWEGAKTYIQEVADANIMVGEYDASGRRIFRPKDNLSYVEGIQLAYSLLKSNNALSSKDSFKTKWEAVMKSYKIPEWAYESVSYGLEKGIVKPAELTKFYSGTSANFASREDVCLFFGRALGTVMDIPSRVSFNFNDKDKISDTAGKYVQLLVNEKIIVGDDVNNFNPANKMNRSELAVVVSKTNKVLSGGNIVSAKETVKGILTSVGTFGSDYLISVLSNNATKGFLAAADITVTDSNGAEISFDDLKSGDEVIVGYEGSSALEIVRTVVSSALEGHITGMTETEITIKSDDGKEYTYNIQKGANVLINELKSDVEKLVDIYEDAYVNARLSFNSDGNVILIDADSRTSVSYGEVKELTSEYVSIRKSSGTLSEGDFAKNVEFYFDGTKCDYDKIEESYKYEKEFYARLYFNTAYEIYKAEFSSTEESENSVSGTIISAYGENDDSSKDNTITIMKSDGKRYTYAVTSIRRGDYKLECELDDKAVSLDDLGEEAKLADVTAYLTMNDGDKVYKIKATTQDTSYDITIRDIEDGNLKFTSKKNLDENKIESGSRNVYVYDISRDVDVTLDGDKVSLSELEDEMISVGADYLSASIVIDKDSKVVSIDAVHTASSASEEIDGILANANDFDVDDREITITKRGKQTTYPLASKSKTYYWVNDVAFGSSGDGSGDNCAEDFYSCIREYKDIDITLTVNASGKVTKVSAEIPDSYIIYGKVTSYSSGAKLFSIETSRGDKYTISGDSDTQCFYNDKQYSSVASIGGFYDKLTARDDDGEFIYSNREMTIKAIIVEKPSLEKVNVASLIYAELD